MRALRRRRSYVDGVLRGLAAQMKAEVLSYKRRALLMHHPENTEGPKP